MNEDAFNMSMRKFLKKVGVTSQQEIEKAVRAAADTTFSLPEVSMGLIPGAGGTVSVPARIGRHRTVTLALSGRRIDVDTALAWGLVDELIEAPSGATAARGS